MSRRRVALGHTSPNLTDCRIYCSPFHALHVTELPADRSTIARGLKQFVAPLTCALGSLRPRRHDQLFQPKCLLLVSLDVLDDRQDGFNLARRVIDVRVRYAYHFRERVDLVSGSDEPASAKPGLPLPLPELRMRMKMRACDLYQSVGLAARHGRLCGRGQRKEAQRLYLKSFGAWRRLTQIL